MVGVVCTAATSERLFYPQQLDLKGQGGVGWNDSGVAAASVGVIRRTDQLGFLTNRHLSNSLVPTADDLATANLEAEGLSPGARRIKHGSIVQRSGVVDHGGLARLGEGGLIAVGNRDNLNAHSEVGSCSFAKKKRK